MRLVMDLSAFFESRVCIVSGKGGVGKTTLSAVLAVMAASSGQQVLLVDVEGKSGLSNAFGANPLEYEAVTLSQGVFARNITAEQALLEFFQDHNLNWVSKRLQSMNLVDVIATAAPGIKDILVLGKVKQIERRGTYDLIIVDAPAAGHTLTFLNSAAGLIDAVRVGPVRTQARDVQEMLTDPSRTQVILTTLPEETPVNETVETAEALVDLKIKVGAVLVNGWYSPCPAATVDEIRAAAVTAGTVMPDEEAQALADASSFVNMRHRLQQTQLARLEDMLALPILQLPFLFTADLGRPGIDTLTKALETAITDFETEAPAVTLPSSDGKTA